MNRRPPLLRLLRLLRLWRWTAPSPPDGARPLARPLVWPRICQPLIRWSLGCCCLLIAWPVLALDLNTATEAELDGLSGFGPAFTARVMQARADRPFQDWADFMRRVKGVREATAWRLSRQGARIQQSSFVPPAARVSRD